MLGLTAISLFLTSSALFPPESRDDQEKQPRASPAEVEGAVAEMFQRLMRTPIEPKQLFENLLETLEVLKGAISASDKDKAFEALTIFAMQFTAGFAGTDVFKKTYPLLEELKHHIESGDFEESLVYTLAFQAKFRSVLDSLHR